MTLTNVTLTGARINVTVAYTHDMITGPLKQNQTQGTCI